MHKIELIRQIAFPKPTKKSDFPIRNDRNVNSCFFRYFEATAIVTVRWILLFIIHEFSFFLLIFDSFDHLFYFLFSFNCAGFNFLRFFFDAVDKTWNISKNNCNGSAYSEMRHLMFFLIFMLEIGRNHTGLCEIVVYFDFLLFFSSHWSLYLTSSETRTIRSSRNDENSDHFSTIWFRVQYCRWFFSQIKRMDFRTLPAIGFSEYFSSFHWWRTSKMINSIFLSHCNDLFEDGSFSFSEKTGKHSRDKPQSLNMMLFKLRRHVWQLLRGRPHNFFSVNNSQTNNRSR